MWILKKNQAEFEMVDGAFAGRIYRHNQQYAEIPPEKAACFIKVALPSAEQAEKKAAIRKPAKKREEKTDEKL